MNVDEVSARRFPNRLCWLLLVAGTALVIPVRRGIDRFNRQTADSSDGLYLASGESLRALSVGYDGLLADIYWTRVVQYYGRQRLSGSGRFDLLGPLLQITTTLDPHLIVAYRFGAVFLAEKSPSGAGRPSEALHLLHRGIVANPDYWRLWQDLGFIYYWDLQDYGAAARAFQTGAERPGAQVWMRALAATVAAKGGELRTARLLWSEIYRHAESAQVRRSAEDHLLALAAQEELDMLNDRLAQYRTSAGHVARSFDDLVAAGLLPRAPADPTGALYVINSDGRANLSPASRVDLALIR